MLSSIELNQIKDIKKIEFEKIKNSINKTQNQLFKDGCIDQDWNMWIDFSQNTSTFEFLKKIFLQHQWLSENVVSKENKHK